MMDRMDVKLEIAEKYRRLRILDNRLQLFGNPVFYTYWREFIFRTDLGLRRVITTQYTDEKTGAVIYELIYENPEIGEPLFTIVYDRTRYFINSAKLTPEEVWLAIYEIEQISSDICRDIVKEI